MLPNSSSAMTGVMAGQRLVIEFQKSVGGNLTKKKGVTGLTVFLEWGRALRCIMRVAVFLGCASAQVRSSLTLENHIFSFLKRFFLFLKTW